jgi:hypothetical protein
MNRQQPATPRSGEAGSSASDGVTVRLLAAIILGSALCASVQLLQAELIDRVAVSLGRTVITEGEVVEEIRLTALLNGADPDLDVQSKRETAARLVDQAIILEEIRQSRYSEIAEEEIDQALVQLKKEEYGGSQLSYESALAQYGVTEAHLRAHLARQLAVLQFVETRFAPGVQVLDSEVSNYYENVLLPRLAAGGAKAPPLEQVRFQIERILREEQVDRYLEAWLEEARKRAGVEYREKVFL